MTSVDLKRLSIRIPGNYAPLVENDGEGPGRVPRRVQGARRKSSGF
ncbi:hypothetical protein [Jannaschia seohaensis]|nr:hypothetical protein [Jannaschia seohaensis]